MGAGASAPSAAPAELVAAEVALLRARAAADATRAAADTAATAEKAASETSRAAADAAATAAKAAGETSRARADVLARLLPSVLCVAGLAALAADFYVHESPAYIQRRMLAALRARRTPPGLGAASALGLPRLRAPQSPLAPAFLPTMLLGPTGCGKSTLLAELARSLAAAPAPAAVVHVRLRLPLGARAEGAAAPPPPASAAALMDAVAAQVFSQIASPRGNRS